MDDAEYVMIAYGGNTRSALSAMKLCREKGIKAGVLQIVTVWPLPEKEIREVMETAKAVFVPELNLGQYLNEVRVFNTKNIPCVGINRVNGYPIHPHEIVSRIEEVIANDH